MVPPTHHFSDMCPFFFTPQSYKISPNHASGAMRSSDRPNRDNRPNKPNRQALPEQRHHTGTADAAPPPPPRALPKQRNAPPPVATHWLHWPYPARCLSSATHHRLSQPIGPIRPIPARCQAALSSRSHKVACPIITRYNAVVPGWVDTPTKCVPKVRPSLLANPLATGAYLRHAPGRGGANPGTTAVVPGYEQGCRFAALRCTAAHP